MLEQWYKKETTQQIQHGSVSWKTLGNFFLCGCIDLVKTSVSVSSRNKISFGLLFGAVNGCEETHLSKWGLQPVQ